MARRHQGHVRQRSPGTWEIRYSLGQSADGKWKTATTTFKAARKKDAEDELARLQLAQKNGTDVEPHRMKVEQFLDRWLAHIKTQVSPKSCERYNELAKKNLVPLLGGVLLCKLKPMQISEAYATALASGRRDGKGGLSPRTVHHMHRVLWQALEQAVVWQLLARNPAAAVEPPKIERKQMKVLDTDGTADFIETARGTGMFMPIMLAVMCGLRRGEIAALRWHSVNLDNGQLSVVASVEQTEKGVREKETKSGRDRTVELPSIVIEELRRHRIGQAENLLRLGVRLTDHSHVCAREDGQPLQPRSFTHAFRKFVRRRGLQRIRFHDLRHSHATQMLKDGIHPKIAQERLGHSSVSITLDLYSHVLPGMQAEAASRVDDALRAALSRRQKTQ